MVKMSVANKNIVHLNVIGGESFGIAVQIRVKNNGRIVFSNYKACVINIMEFCGHKRSSFGRQPCAVFFLTYIILKNYLFVNYLEEWSEKLYKDLGYGVKL